ncbi:PREDICTED: elongation of very long chain fatty acids protein 7-like [Dufourea novaeangliae]|uniref:elongation of very long chain fatty acids protein 7-like n=1 Tax=Dufourea novaeangliae TaxID=178035 RepID=UPI000766F9FC|nr:PREDICTED: elongation of very long chain fatty acids protein 7-like [Dufourea novaeangliae]
MATLIRRIYYGYRYINDELSDPRTQDFFLIGSPWATVGILVFYLYFVHELGPNLMAKRKPFDLKRVMQLYNVIQIVLCSYLVYQAIILAWLDEYNIYCEPVDYSWTPHAIRIARVVWLYFIVKLLDLLDTVFFVLRKKQNQVSFLHVYHHAGMSFGTWAATKFLAGGHLTFLGSLNSFVHVVMYSYYLATSLRISRPWWKKYITQLQLFQFFLIMLHFVVLVWVEDCGFPKWTAAVLIPQNLFMMVLFGDFYYKTYIRKPRPKVSQNGNATEATNGKLKSQ